MLEFVKKLLTPDAHELMNAAIMPELKAPKSRFQKQIEEHERVESRLRKAHYELEKQVEELTIELSKSREFLKHEVSERKWDQQLIQDYRDYANSVTDIMREPFVVLNSHMKVMMANRSFCRAFGHFAEEIETRVFFEANDNEWDIMSLRKAMEEVLHEKGEPQEIEIDHEFRAVGRKVMKINISRVHRKENGADMLLLAMEDVTERKEIEEKINNWSKNDGDSRVALKKTRKNKIKEGQRI